MKKYTITVTFETDRELNAEELDHLETAVVTQVLEPADLDGNDVEYQTASVIITTVEREGENDLQDM